MTKLKLTQDVTVGHGVSYAQGEEFLDRATTLPVGPMRPVSKTEDGEVLYLPNALLVAVVPELRKVSDFPKRSEPFYSWCEKCDHFFLNDIRDRHAECPDCTPPNQLYNFSSWEGALQFVESFKRDQGAKDLFTSLFSSLRGGVSS